MTVKLYKKRRKLVWEKLLTRRNSVFMDCMKLHGASHIFLNIGYDYRIKNYKIVNNDNYVAQDYNLYVENLKNKYKKNKNILDRIFNLGISNIKKFVRLWRKIGKINAKKLSDERLKFFFEEYVGILHKLMAYLYIPLFADKILTEEVSRIIKKYSGETNISVLLPILTIPEEFNAVQKENIDFLKMMLKIGKNKAKNNKLIISHLSKWGWLGDHNFFGDFWTINDIVRRIKDLKNKNFTSKIAAIKQDFKNAKINYRRIVKKWNVTQREKDTLKLAKEFVYFRTFRLDMLFYSEFLVRELLSEIAERLNLSYGDLMMLSPAEISNAIMDRKNYRQEISRRKKSYAIILENYKVKLYSAEKARRFIEFEEINNDIKEIKGNPAFPGVVEGLIKIIINKADFKKFNPGEILVTPMTTPDFVPLMKQSLAIITDEGGITCHAAIVAREMKKPCVIGTKLATKLLSDGDLVKVDAGKGIVKILKKQ